MYVFLHFQCGLQKEILIGEQWANIYCALSKPSLENMNFINIFQKAIFRRFRKLAWTTIKRSNLSQIKSEYVHWEWFLNFHPGFNKPMITKRQLHDNRTLRKKIINKILKCFNFILKKNWLVKSLLYHPKV